MSNAEDRGQTANSLSRVDRYTAQKKSEAIYSFIFWKQDVFLGQSL